jgi:hypothetical protein
LADKVLIVILLYKCALFLIAMVWLIQNLNLNVILDETQLYLVIKYRCSGVAGTVQCWKAHALLCNIQNFTMEGQQVSLDLNDNMIAS